MGSTLISIHGGGHWRCLVVVIRFCCRPFLSLFIAVRCLLLSIFILVHHALLNGFASLALRLAMGGIDGGVVALVGCRVRTYVATLLISKSVVQRNAKHVEDAM